MRLVYATASCLIAANVSLSALGAGVFIFFACFSSVTADAKFHYLLFTDAAANA